MAQVQIATSMMPPTQGLYLEVMGSELQEKIRGVIRWEALQPLTLNSQVAPTRAASCAVRDHEIPVRYTPDPVADRLVQLADEGRTQRAIWLEFVAAHLVADRLYRLAFQEAHEVLAVQRLHYAQTV